MKYSVFYFAQHVPKIYKLRSYSQFTTFSIEVSYHSNARYILAIIIWFNKKVLPSNYKHDSCYMSSRSHIRKWLQFISKKFDQTVYFEFDSTKSERRDGMFQWKLLCLHLSFHVNDPQITRQCNLLSNPSSHGVKRKLEEHKEPLRHWSQRNLNGSVRSVTTIHRTTHLSRPRISNLMFMTHIFVGLLMFVAFEYLIAANFWGNAICTKGFSAFFLSLFLGFGCKSFK